MIPPELLLMAYREGVFPMAMRNGEIGWFSPDPRGILPLDAFRVPHGLRRTLRRNSFKVKIDTAFRRVMEGCAARPDTWIDEVILDSYCELHRQGYAHSVESWFEGELVGGVYGVSIRGAFFGESMFHRVTDASKVALHALVSRLQERRFSLLDIQWVTPHLASFGAIEIPRHEYLRRLAASLRVETQFRDNDRLATA